MRGVRALIVDDFEGWRNFTRTELEKLPGLLMVAEASDGLEAVKKAEELQPDLILLDISLPTLNGIHAARQIRQVAPNSKILFVSENRSADIVDEALNSGGRGFVTKSDAARELLPAIKAVLGGQAIDHAPAFQVTYVIKSNAATEVVSAVNAVL